MLLLTMFAVVFGLTLPIDQEKKPAIDAKEEQAYTYTLEEAIHTAANEYHVPEGLLYGIAAAESSLGTKWYGCDFSYNAWGIKGKPAETCNQSLKYYASWEESARDAARILKTYYLEKGLTTPEQIVLKYVGMYSPTWVYHVKKFYP